MSKKNHDDCREVSDDFWAQRDCFLDPIPEIDEAIALLDRAADAILSKQFDLAASYVRNADIPQLCQFAQEITGPTNLGVHRFREIPGAPQPTTARMKKRMPSKSVERSVFARDGWRCRYCGCRIIVSGAIKRICLEVPKAAAWGKWGNAGHEHCGFRVVCASLDHILPHSRGGDNKESNLVTACYPCQFGRNQWTLEEVGFRDPRAKPPQVDGWDGLTRLC